MPKILIALLLTAIAGTGAANTLEESHPGIEDFIRGAVEEHQLAEPEVRAILSKANKKSNIIKIMERPGEAKPWHEYRPLFLNADRIKAGTAFWLRHETLIKEASETYGVPEEIIVAIIGVETYYGKITGGFGVLDALVTLSFHYPKRAPFFQRELGHFLKLGIEEDLPLTEIEGSYAGAMGLGQFMPSSYRNFAVDFDKDGRRQLWASPADAIASVANYLNAHGWENSAPVADQIMPLADAQLEDINSSVVPSTPSRDFITKGLQPVRQIDPDRLASVVTYEVPDGTEYWLTYQNFYVLTRYNRSTKYAMAVFHLSQALANDKSRIDEP